MFKKEIQLLSRKSSHWILCILPFFLAFFMSEGTKNYLNQWMMTGEAVSTNQEIVLYTGKIIDAKTQFAISELHTMLFMVSTLIGLHIFEERKLHIWDRVIAKERFLSIIFLTYYLFSFLMIIVNLILYRVIFKLNFPISSILLFLSIPFISLNMGLVAGLYLQSRSVIVNVLMMICMLFGYLGGALSLVSVLSTTKIMDKIMYLSPISLANKIVFSQMLDLSTGNYKIFWFVLVFMTIGISIILIRRKVYDSIL